MQALPEDAFDENGKLVKYIFMRSEPNPAPPDGEGRMVWEEDAGISWWTGDDPDNAPDGYELIEDPTKSPRAE